MIVGFGFGVSTVAWSVGGLGFELALGFGLNW